MCAGLYDLDGNTAIIYYNAVHNCYEVWAYDEIVLETYDYVRAVKLGERFGYVIDVTHLTIVR